MENPRISIKYAQKILSKEQKYLWNFWINTTKDNFALKLTVDEMLRKMLKNPVLRNPIYMVMNSDYKHRSSGLFKYIYPQNRLKCPLCDIEFDDLRNEYKVNSLKKHIVDHLSGNLMITKEKVVFNPELNFMKWIIPKLEYYNKLSYDDGGWTYKCKNCKLNKGIITDIDENMVKMKAIYHLAIDNGIHKNSKKSFHNLLRKYLQKDGRFNDAFIHNMYFLDDFSEVRHAISGCDRMYKCS